MSTTQFPNYLELREQHPISVKQWWGVRIASLIATLTLCFVLVIDPNLGLFVFWGLVVPVLPLVFFLAPGLWRNICPLAAANQTPRLLGFTKALTAPPWLIRYGYVIAFGSFFALVSLRKVVFNDNGPAVAALIAGAVIAAFAGGTVLKGKSGWCSSMCPLLPVQRLYGQTPFAVIPNSHCDPCVGCTKNCYDFNPKVAYVADQHDDEPRWASRRRLFAGTFPGFVLAFYLVPSPPEISTLEMYARFGLFVAASAALFFALDAVVETTPATLTTFFGATALNIYYWFTAPLFFDGIAERLVGGPAPDALAWILRASVLCLSLVWIYRTIVRERVYRSEVTDPVAYVEDATLQAIRSTSSGDPEVTFSPDQQHVVVEPGSTLLEVAEHNEVPIEAGCRMGLCGSDPISVIEGATNLTPLGDDERRTLERLGLAPNARMACSARVCGPVSVSLAVEKSSDLLAQSFEFDRSVTKVVVIGNGIAGVTAADHIRRLHPDCEIALVGREKHHFYNRMAISRLIYGRSAMQGLFLLPDAWYDEHRIRCWLNTTANAIDRSRKVVELGTGEELPYDRVVLTTGARSFLPPIGGWGRLGCFALREADDAMSIRAFAQRPEVRHAVVAGGGLLGLEAGYALLKLNLRVSVLERSAHLLRRQLDAAAAELLRARLEDIGLHILTRADTDSVTGTESVERLLLKDGRALNCELVLVAAGIEPDVSLARDAGLDVDRGVVVDDRLRSSDPAIYAAGDAAELEGAVSGLWPVAVEQAEAAAHNVAGGDRPYEPSAPVTMLKVVGVELTSLGTFSAGEGHEEIVISDEIGRRYRKIVLDGTRAIGGILLGHPEYAALLTSSVKEGRDLGSELEALRRGDWASLTERVLQQA